MGFIVSLKSVFRYFLVVFFLSITTLNAHAGEGNFGWVYTLDIQLKGKFEFEQRVDQTDGQATGNYELTLFRSEIEYGLTDAIQIAGYLNSTRIRASKNYINPDVCTNGIPCTVGFGVSSEYNEGVDSFKRWDAIDGFSAEAI